MTTRLLVGDCRQKLAELADESVHCIVTSPPYYGLRSYGIGIENGEIGLEATPEAYVAELVAVFRECRRVMRSDGTVFLNLGDAYSTGKGSNVTDQLNRLLECGSVFFADAGSCGVAGHGVGVALQHERAPDGELSGLFAPQRDAVEQWHQHLGKVADLFAGPGGAGAGSALGGVFTNAANSQVVSGKYEHGAIVTAQLDAQSEAVLTVLRPSSARPGKDDETGFAIHKPDKPSIGGNVRWHSAWHAFATEAILKGLEDIHLVDQTVSLGDRPQALAGLLCDFRVTKASEKQVTFTSVHGGLTLTVSNVSQLWFVLRCGSVVPYRKLLGDANRFANAMRPKQEIGIPDLVKRALMEDGWICRQTIIWAKPNPMPESIRDRCTKAHEYLFLLSKSDRYYYDAEAIAEDSIYAGKVLTGLGSSKDFDPVRQRTQPRGERTVTDTRNRRSVWTIPSAPFSEAHFATFPPALVEPCIKAGCPAGGTVLDPFGGAGTTGLVADRLGRNAVLIELNPAYAGMMRDRIVNDAPLFAEVMEAAE